MVTSHNRSRIRRLILWASFVLSFIVLSYGDDPLSPEYPSGGTLSDGHSYYLYDGSRIEVAGNGVVTVYLAGGGYYPGIDTPVATNICGTCTNCSNVTVSQLREYASRIQAMANNLYPVADEILTAANSVSSFLDWFDDQAYMEFCSSGSASHWRDCWNSISNSVLSSDNLQGELVRNYFENASSTLAGSVIGVTSATYATGVYDAYNAIAASPAITALRSVPDSLQHSIDQVFSVATSAEFLSTQLRRIEECPSPGTNCMAGATNSCNSCVSGECPCKEQLAAITNALYKVKLDTGAQLQQLSNYLHTVTNIRYSIDSIARALLGTERVYTTVADSWTNVYFSGHSTLFDYHPTNALHRIELLLYGLALGDQDRTNSYNGVGANFDKRVDDTRASVSNSLDDVEASVSSADSLHRTVGREFLAAVNRFLDSFGPRGEVEEFGVFKVDSSEFFPSEGEDNTYAVNLDSDGADTLRDFATFVRVCLSGVYGVFFLCGLWVFWRSVLVRTWRYFVFFVKLLQAIFT